MILSKTGFRISFFGGGTDYPIYYKQNGGAVLSTTINQHCYIQVRFINSIFKDKFRLRYSEKEDVNNLEDIKHPSIRECIRFFNLDKEKNGIEIVHTSDIPSNTGLGSSSAFSVGLLNSLYSLKGNIVSKRKLAEDAIFVEQKMIEENVGSQDQIAAAYGGFNLIEFGKNNDDKFEVHPITIGKDKINLLERNCMLFFTGYQRIASEIAKVQINNTYKNLNELKKMKEMVYEAIDILCSNSTNDDIIWDFGKLLDESWKLKRGLSNKITNLEIDKIYEQSMKAGAIGGKILGAGGGGCILFIVPPEDQHKVEDKLKNLVHIPFKFSNEGSRIIYYES